MMIDNPYHMKHMNLNDWLMNFPGIWTWLLPLTVSFGYGAAWALDDLNVRRRRKLAPIRDDWRADV